MSFFASQLACESLFTMPFAWWRARVTMSEMNCTHPCSFSRALFLLIVFAALIRLFYWGYSGRRFRDFPTTGTVARLGYHNTHTFCGGVVRPGRAIQEWECDLIYEPSQGNLDWDRH